MSPFAKKRGSRQKSAMCPDSDLPKLAQVSVSTNGNCWISQGWETTFFHAWVKPEKVNEFLHVATNKHENFSLISLFEHIISEGRLSELEQVSQPWANMLQAHILGHWRWRRSSPIGKGEIQVYFCAMSIDWLYLQPNVTSLIAYTEFKDILVPNSYTRKQLASDLKVCIPKHAIILISKCFSFILF